MIQVSGLTKSFGERVLFQDLSFQIGEKERVGLVGRNGSGKSTLFKILAGKEGYDDGEISLPRNYEVATLDQHISFSFSSVLEEVCSVLSKEREFEVYEGEKILSGLGFSESDFDRDPNDFSGGYQVRISLAKVLLKDPNLLLLDEPTNYLDIVSLRWLERFLKDFQGEVIIITHDRTFMDMVCTHVMGIHRKSLKKVKGNTTKFYEQLKTDEELYEQTRLNQEKKKKEIEGFVERFKAKASKARQANSRKKMLDKMQDLEVLEKIPEIEFSFRYSPCPSKFPVQIKNLSFGYSKDKLLFKGLDVSVENGDKIAIIGKNGKGKSTLLNCIAGFLEPISGEIEFHSMIKVGHFGQMNIDRLHPKNSIYQEVAEVNDDLRESEIRSICGSMLFSGDDADKHVSVLSGGEKARVMLAKILATKCNLLLLDEPTNHLDMESIEVLGKAIQSFEGTVLLVTHNEFLVNQVANKLIVFREGSAELFLGNYQDFLKKIGWEEESDKNEKSVQPKNLESPKKKEIQEKEEPKDTSQIEEQIIQLESLKESFEELLAKKASNGEDISELSKKLSEINNKIEEKLDLL